MRDSSRPIQGFLAQLPGWTLLVGGMAILGTTVLMPTWMECQYLNWQLNVMQRQTDALAQQVQAYRAFHKAVKDDDPVVLKRLAFHQLRAKPKGAALLLTAPAEDPSLAASAMHTAQTPAAPLVRATSPLEQTEHGSFIEAWLHQPLPRVGREIAPFHTVHSRFTRLTMGPPRLIVALFGIVCMLCGLAFHPVAPQPSPGDQDDLP